MAKGKVNLGIQNVDGEEVEVRDSCFHEVEEYIEANINKPAMLTTSVLAKQFNYSPSQF